MLSSETSGKEILYLIIPSEGFDSKTLFDICEHAVTKSIIIKSGADQTPNNTNLENLDGWGCDDFTSAKFN